MATRARNIGGRLTYWEGSTGKWTGRHSSYRYHDNFDTYTSLETTAANGNPWEGQVVGAAPPTAGFASITSTGKGLQLATTSASQEQLTAAHWADQLVLSLDRNLVVQWEARLTVLPTLIVDGYLGVGSAANADGLGATTYSAAFVLDVAGAVSARIDDNSAVVSASTGITMVVNTWYVFRMEVFDVSNIRFAIDGAYVATSTDFDMSAVTAGANRMVQPTANLYKASGAGVGTMQVRSFDAWQD